MCDEVDCKPKVTETTGATYSVEVGFRCLREVKVDDHVHSLNVNASCQQVWMRVCVHVGACVYTYT